MHLLQEDNTKGDVLKELSFCSSKCLNPCVLRNPKSVANTLVRTKETWLIGVCALCCLPSKPKVSLTSLCSKVAPDCHTDQSKDRYCKQERSTRSRWSLLHIFLLDLFGSSSYFYPLCQYLKCIWDHKASLNERGFSLDFKKVRAWCITMCLLQRRKDRDVFKVWGLHYKLGSVWPWSSRDKDGYYSFEKSSKFIRPFRALDWYPEGISKCF